jgi:hypothetical protein
VLSAFNLSSQLLLLSYISLTSTFYILIVVTDLDIKRQTRGRSSSNSLQLAFSTQNGCHYLFCLAQTRSLHYFVSYEPFSQLHLAPGLSHQLSISIVENIITLKGKLSS